VPDEDVTQPVCIAGEARRLAILADTQNNPGCGGSSTNLGRNAGGGFPRANQIQRCSRKTRNRPVRAKRGENVQSAPAVRKGRRICGLTACKSSPGADPNRVFAMCRTFPMTIRRMRFNQAFKPRSLRWMPVFGLICGVWFASGTSLPIEPSMSAVPLRAN